MQQLSLFTPPPDPAADAAIAALESLKAIAPPPEPAAPRIPPCHCCHVPSCTVPISLSMLMCPKHWRQVPKPLQQAVWAHYRSGQEEDKNPSADYLKAARAAINAVTGAQNPAPQPTALAQPQATQVIEQPHRPAPGTRCTLRPLVDSQGRTRETWAGKVLTIRGYCPQGFALLDVGTSHPYPASVDRLEVYAPP